MKHNTLKYLVLSLTFITINKTVAQDQFSVLLYTQHDDWHSNTIPVAIQAFEDMASENQFKFDWTQRPNEVSINRLIMNRLTLFVIAYFNVMIGVPVISLGCSMPIRCSIVGATSLSALPSLGVASRPT